jgi:hypothetical protein
MPIEQQLLTAALLKWQMGEPLSPTDFDRFLNLLNTVAIQVIAPNQEIQQAKYAELRRIMRERYVNPPAQ